MLTRTFLFLLAMMTGFVPANAAHAARSQQSEIGASADISIKAASFIAVADIRHGAAAWQTHASLRSAANAAHYSVDRQYKVVPVKPIYRGDRTRE